MWWYIPVISALGRLWQEDHEFEDNLGYTAKLYLEQNKAKQKRSTDTCYNIDEP
jgi:hypothetical protein